jgi:hypothetical protein
MATVTMTAATATATDKRYDTVGGIAFQDRQGVACADPDTREVASKVPTKEAATNNLVFMLQLLQTGFLKNAIDGLGLPAFAASARLFAESTELLFPSQCSK